MGLKKEKYIYNNVHYSDGYRIEEYDPIGVMISINGTVKMTFTKISILTNNNFLCG